ncbi:MAG: TlpA disulfide reductase family protein [Planctomycetaceae bacterium]|jgi:thiol-disulfide isomerase/thioredoxin|nr:TlpA disulfide reductase family protein [Planctomycetaceae bacterium]
MRHRCCYLFVVLVFGIVMHAPSLLHADETESYAESQHQNLHDQFTRTLDWFGQQSSPYSNDTLDGLEWLLDTGIEQGWYSELTLLVNQSKLEEGLQTALQKKVQSVRILGFASEQKPEESLRFFVDHLKTVRIRQPNDTLALAYALSAQFQINGDYTAAREVYRRTIDAFFLNEQVRTICERRRAKLLLAGEEAPALMAGDQALSDLRGKYVFIDFWATNCAPCIIDLPHLRSVSRRYSGDQFQILGISFDTEPSIVEEFKQRHRIDWATPLLEKSSPDARDQYRVITIPSTFVVDPAGKIVLVDGQARDVQLLLEHKLDKK